MSSSPDKSWDKEISSITDTLLEMTPSKRFEDGVEVKRLKENLRSLPRDLVRRLPEFMESVPEQDRDFNYIAVHVLGANNSDAKLEVIYRHAVHFMDQYMIGLNTAVFLLSDIVNTKPDDEPKLTIEQERLILDIHVELLALAQRELDPRMRSVILDYPEDKERIIQLLAQREFTNPQDLEDVLNEYIINAVHDGVL